MAAATHVLALFHNFARDGEFPFARDIFLQNHGIGAVRQHRTGEDANCSAGRHALGWLMPGQTLADDAPALQATIADAIRPHRVAIHRRCIERRQVHRRNHVFGQRATNAVRQVDGFGLVHGPGQLTQTGDGDIDIH